MSASGKRFIIDKQSDPLDFLSWLVNSLHTDLTGGKRKKRSGAYWAMLRCCPLSCVFSCSLFLFALICWTLLAQSRPCARAPPTPPPLLLLLQ